MIGLVFVVLVALFLVTPWTGDDWQLFHQASKQMLKGEPLYVIENYYYNPAWVAIIIAPFALLPEHFGWGVISAVTLLVIPLTLMRWQPNPGWIKPALALLSPPAIYIFIHGQLDAIVIALALLPTEWWMLAALTKPQVAMGLVVGIPVSRWPRMLVFTAGVFVLSFILIGFWPRDLLNQPTPIREAGHNFWLGLWPFQVPLGVALLAVGWSRRDARLLVAASPFLPPYAAISSLLGPWLAALTYLNTWQAALVLASWWGAVAYRAFM
jgi:hypothetical protein